MPGREIAGAGFRFSCSATRESIVILLVLFRRPRRGQAATAATRFVWLLRALSVQAVQQPA
jgi:hypothetical protein